MSKIVTKARQLRLNHQAKLGRSVPLREIAEETGLTEATLSRLESGKTERIDFDTLRKLCAFYGVGVGEILEYDPNNLAALTQQGLEPVAA